MYKFRWSQFECHDDSDEQYEYGDVDDSDEDMPELIPVVHGDDPYDEEYEACVACLHDQGLLDDSDHHLDDAFDDEYEAREALLHDMGLLDDSDENKEDYETDSEYEELVQDYGEPPEEFMYSRTSSD